MPAAVLHAVSRFSSTLPPRLLVMFAQREMNVARATVSAATVMRRAGSAGPQDGFEGCEPLRMRKWKACLMLLYYVTSAWEGEQVI